MFRLRNAGALYVLMILIIASSIALPHTFPTLATVKQVVNGNSVTALAALAIIAPLSAGVFDLSFGYTMTLSGVTVAYFVVNSNFGITESLVVGVVIGLIVGVINAIVVVVIGIDSFIGTLATGSIIESLIIAVTGGNDITSAKLLGPFSDIGQFEVGGFTLPGFYVLGLAIAIWYTLEYTMTGRRLYAVGFNRDAAMLAGIRAKRLQFGALVTSATIAALAGVVLASVIGAGSTDAGTTYLLPAFTAAFLGATQLKAGRFNAWGTVLGVVLLGTGLAALGLGAAPEWAAQAYTGVVLIAALAAASTEQRRLIRPWRRRAADDTAVPLEAAVQDPNLEERIDRNAL